MNNIYISNICPWAPELLDSPQLWHEWVLGQKEIPQIKDAPKLEYTDSLFRRRLSQITKMTIQVVHNLLEQTNIDKNTKIVFASLRGEIEREFTINKGLIQDEMILPAGFSLSVFNTPISSATLAFNLKGGYTVIYPSQNNFADAFKMAIASVLSGEDKSIIFVYADELVPEVYGDKRPLNNIPMAFSCLISNKKTEKAISFTDLGTIPSTPQEFLKQLLSME